MAGANGVPKFLQVNREDEVQDPKSRGVFFWNEDPINYVPISAISNGSFLLRNLIINPSVPNSSTIQNISQTFDALSKNYLSTDGSIWTIFIENKDPVNTKTINLPAGFTNLDGSTPASIVIPPSSVIEQSFQVVSQISQTIRLYNYTLSGSSASAAPTSYLSLNVPGAIVPGLLVASGTPLTLFSTGTFTNDPASFTFASPSSDFTINISGKYKFDIDFVTCPNVGDGDSWALTDTVASPGTTLFGSIFGKGNGPYPTLNQFNFGPASEDFVLDVVAPQTFRITNVSTMPGHTLLKAVNILPLANPNPGAGYIVVTRFS